MTIANYVTHPRVMAQELGLEYEALQPWYNMRAAARALDLAGHAGVYRAIRDGHLKAEVIDTGGRNCHYRISRDELLLWAYTRKRGPEPLGAIGHPTKKSRSGFTPTGEKR